MSIHVMRPASVGLAIFTALAARSSAAEPSTPFVGYVNPQYGLSTDPLDESLLELNGFLGYRLRTRPRSLLLAVARTQLKHDDRDAQHPWNDFRETAIGLQMRWRDLVSAGVEAGYHEATAGGAPSARYLRVYAGHWQRRPLAPLTASRAWPLIPVVTHSSSASFNTREDTLVAAGSADVSLQALRWERHLTIGPALGLQLSTDTAGLAWNRFAEAGAGIEAASAVADVPLYARASVVRRTPLGGSGTRGTFLKVVVGVWKSF